MPLTDWLVGSVPIPAQAFTIGATGVSVDAGTYYLRHPTAGLSLLAQVVEALTAAAVGSPAAVVLQSRRVRISGGSAFSVTWGASTLLRDLLGFTGNLGAATEHVAPHPSPLLWSPGGPGTPATIPGRVGFRIPHRNVRTSDDGTRHEVDYFGETTRQRRSWALIPIDRLQVADDENPGGTFDEFFDRVCVRGHRLRYHESIFESADASPVFWNDSSAFGPYATLSPDSGDWYNRLIANADDYGGGLEMLLQLVDEVS